MAFLGPSLRRKKVTDRPAVRIAAAAAISLALNAAFFALLVHVGAFAPLKLGRTEQVALQALTADQWNANRAIAGLPSPAAAPRPPASAQQAPPAQPPPTPEVKPPPPEKQPKGQVVDVAPSDDSRAPDKARFLSERDNRVEKETRSRWAGSEVYKNRAPAPVHGDQQGEQQPKAVGEGGKDRQSREAKAEEGGTNGRAGKEGARHAQEPKPTPSTADDRLALLEPPRKPGLLEPRPEPVPGEKAPPQGESQEGLGTPGAPGEKQDRQAKLGDPRLLPSVPSMSRITAGPSADYLDRDIEEGDATALNTREFKFATFWNRFKQDVAEHWIPTVRYSLTSRDPDGTTFGGGDRLTQLHITLDRTGNVKSIDVVRSSGLEFLDRLAVKAVRDASPFYNVPSAVLDPNGELSFPFGFLVEGNRGVPVRPQWRPAQ